MGRLLKLTDLTTSSDIISAATYGPAGKGKARMYYPEMTLPMLVAWLGPLLGGPVVDATGLNGK